VIEAVCSDRVGLRRPASDRGRLGHDLAVDLGDVDASRAVWLGENLLLFGRRGLVSLALEVTAAGIVSEIWTTDGSVGELYHPSGAAFGDGIAVLTSSHRRPPSVVVVDREGAEREVAAPRHAGHDVVLGAVGRREAMRWTSTDGLEIEGLLTLLQARAVPARARRTADRSCVDDRFPGMLDALLSARVRDPRAEPAGSTGRAGLRRPGRRRHGGLDVDDVLPASTPWSPARRPPIASS
jgi:hypothetical protein